jgi:hypothetical protein
MMGKRLNVPKKNLKKVICQGWHVEDKYLVRASFVQLITKLRINQQMA